MLREEALRKAIVIVSYFEAHFAKSKEVREDMVNIIEVLEQEQKTEWIPVSERLPGEEYCLCCDKDGYITIGYISKWSKRWCFEDDEVDIDVIAWMPLPEPYKEG